MMEHILPQPLSPSSLKPAIPPQQSCELDALKDETLAEKWGSGNRAAYEVLVRRHLPSIHRYLAAKCGNQTEADDLCQEVFMDLALKIHLYHPDRPFLSWLYGIAKNRSRQFWKNQRYNEEYLDFHSPEDSLDPSRAMELYEEQQRIWARVFRLIPESQATILWLRVIENLSLDEISQQTGDSIANVKVQLFRARRYLASVWHHSMPSNPSKKPNP